MTVDTELAELLQHWERRLRELGAPCVDHLRPGLTRAEIDTITAAAGLHLADDAAAIWMWHDGDRARYEDDWGRPSLTPSGLFLGLRSAVARSERLRHITDQVRPAGTDLETDPYDDEGTDDEIYFRRTFLILDEDEDPVYLDCTDPCAPTPTGIFITHDTYRTPRMTPTDRIRYRIDALDRGLWQVGPDGAWVVDQTRAPDVERWWDVYA